MQIVVSKEAEIDRDRYREYIKYCLKLHPSPRPEEACTGYIGRHGKHYCSKAVLKQGEHLVGMLAATGTESECASGCVLVFLCGCALIFKAAGLHPIPQKGLLLQLFF